MVNFFLSKKFWCPFLIVIVTALLSEVFLRTGVYDILVKPKSRLGQSLYRVADLKKINSDSIDWVTIGDSKFDWGIDHQQIRTEQEKKGIKHIRLSLAGSNFMTVQSSIEWSLENLPNLDGIMLGLYEAEFLALGHPAKEIKTSWPFRVHLKNHRFNYYRNFRDFNPITEFPKILSSSTFFNSLALTVYFKDIKDFLVNPWQRFAELKKRNKNWLDHINFKHDISENMCEFKLENLSQCIDSAQQMKALKKVPPRYQTPFRKCNQKEAKNRMLRKEWKTPAVDLSPFMDKWQYLFNHILKHEKQIYLVLLPEHKFYNYMSKPSNAGNFTDQLISKYSSLPKFKVLDLRQLFNNSNHCKYFNDSLHFNNIGIEEVTKEVAKGLNELKQS